MHWVTPMIIQTRLGVLPKISIGAILAFFIGINSKCANRIVVQMDIKHYTSSGQCMALCGTTSLVASDRVQMALLATLFWQFATLPK